VARFFRTVGSAKFGLKSRGEGSLREECCEEAITVVIDDVGELEEEETVEEDVTALTSRVTKSPSLSLT
jgi:hypothetical protein